MVSSGYNTWLFTSFELSASGPICGLNVQRCIPKAFASAVFCQCQLFTEAVIKTFMF